ncbi:hypothetical protein AB6A40_001828 [Gnathostoma spinigerum]|uniref:Uncharacterized protein n=1 Tax=Gnathostoma spinigerum TaxID=75299 RepID=A0ABD6E544_9BILA
MESSNRSYEDNSQAYGLTKATLDEFEKIVNSTLNELTKIYNDVCPNSNEQPPLVLSLSEKRKCVSDLMDLIGSSSCLDFSSIFEKREDNPSESEFSDVADDVYSETSIDSVLNRASEEELALYREACKKEGGCLQIKRLANAELDAMVDIETESPPALTETFLRHVKMFLQRYGREQNPS